MRLEEEYMGKIMRVFSTNVSDLILLHLNGKRLQI